MDCDVGNKVLTSHDCLNFLCEQTRGHPMVQGVDDILDLKWVASYLHQSSLEDGLALSDIPSIFIPTQEGTWNETHL
jgi:hypothetical protein